MDYAAFAEHLRAELSEVTVSHREIMMDDNECLPIPGTYSLSDGLVHRLLHVVLRVLPPAPSGEGVVRTIGEIVEAVQEQSDATDEELRLALLSLYYAVPLMCPSDYEGASELKLRMRAQENFALRWRLMKSPPDAWLGDRWKPGTAANAEGRAASKSVLRAFEKARPATTEGE